MKGTKMENLLTIQEVADLLKISTNTVRVWLKQGVLEGLKFPGTRRIYIRKDTLEQKLEVATFEQGAKHE
jgi:excisionase family DNA binding protein